MNKQAYQCDYQNDGCYQQGFKSPTFYFHKTISRNKIKQTADEICPNDKQDIVSFFGSYSKPIKNYWKTVLMMPINYYVLISQRVWLVPDSQTKALLKRKVIIMNLPWNWMNLISLKVEQQCG